MSTFGPTVSVAQSSAGYIVRSAGRTFATSGADAEECASHHAGVLLAAGDPKRLPCSLSEPDAPMFGSAFARFLADKGTTSAVVVADDSPRSQAMTAGFVSSARAHGITVEVVSAPSDVRSWRDAAVITSGWAIAHGALAAIAGASSPPVRGAFLAPWLLSSQNAIRFEFITHKLSRLAVPFALLALLIASMFLPQPFYRAALGAQLAFYALSLAALAGVKIGPLSRIADPARTFVVLNSAAIVAFINFVTGRKAIWVR